MTFEAQPEPLAVETPAALRLQILATEHWSLLASRSLAWNESFSRAAMFLSTVSGAIVALAFVAHDYTVAAAATKRSSGTSASSPASLASSRKV